MASLPKKGPAPAEKGKTRVPRTLKGSPVLSEDEGKKKGPVKDGLSFRGEGAKGRAVKSLDAYNKGGYVKAKAKGMNCGGMARTGKK